MKCDICGEVNDAVEIHLCKRCANKFSDNVNCIKRDLAIYKRALELASIDVGAIAIITKILKDNEVRATSEDVTNYYLDQAKKELEEEDAEN